jgi:hypothetical protein
MTYLSSEISDIAESENEKSVCYNCYPEKTMLPGVFSFPEYELEYDERSYKKSETFCQFCCFGMYFQYFFAGIIKLGVHRSIKKCMFCALAATRRNRDSND